MESKEKTLEKRDWMEDQGQLIGPETSYVRCMMDKV